MIQDSPNMRRPAAAAFLFLIAVVLTACAVLMPGCVRQQAPTGSMTSAGSREFIDDLGETVRVPAKITRIVSLAPNLTEIIFAVGGGDRLVGVTTYCDYPGDAKKIKKIGDTLKPNVENIIALRPEIVFVSTASQLESFTATLEKQGVKVFVTGPSNLDEIYRSISLIGDILGNKADADRLVMSLQKRVADIERRAKTDDPVKTFVQIDRSLFTIGKDSFLTDLIEKAGGLSVTKDVAAAYPKISKEKALALNPDVIILSDSQDNDKPNEVFAGSNAVVNGRVYKIDADLLSRPGPRVVDGLQQISERLRPKNK